MMTTMTAWTLEDTERPWTANAERGWHHYKRAQVVRDARERWAWLATAERIPRLQRISVEATPLRINARSMPDVAACYPAVKAAIDGLVVFLQKRAFRLSKNFRLLQSTDTKSL